MGRTITAALCAVLAFSVLGTAPADAAETSVDIVIVGGPGVVSDEIMADLDAMTSGAVTRLAGSDRYATAAAVSASSFSPGVPVVYIASGLNFPDALAAGPVAALQGGPVLLTRTSSIPAVTKEELERLNPAEIVVVGGVGVVDENVFRSLRGYTDGTVRRLAGADRDATAAAISASHFAPGVPVVFIALGRAFPDALAASAKAAVEGGPILLTKDWTVPTGTRVELLRLQPERIVVVGGPATVPDRILDDLEAYTDGPVERLAGSDRYGTSAAVSSATFDSAADRIYIATGLDFPDALAAGPIAGGAGFVTFGAESGAGPILLVSSVIPTAVRNEIRRLGQGGAPDANPLSVSVPEDTPTAVTMTGSDPDGDALSFAVVTGPAHGTISGAPPTVTYTPDPNYHGADSFTFKANDGSNDSATATITITVTPVNDAPGADGKSVSTNEDTPVAVTFSGSDIEGDPLSFTITAEPANGVVTGAGSNRTYTPDPNYHGGDSFTYVANDGTDTSAPATVSITVTPVNDPPSAEDQAVATPENTAKPITLTATDVENDPLTFTVTSGPSNGSLTGTAPDLTYTPQNGFAGVDSFTFVANDGTDDSAPAIVTITVSDVNNPPSADDKNVTTPEDTSTGVTLSGSDPDNDPLTFVVQTGPTNGTLTGTAPNLTYTPDPNYHGPDSFTYLADDGSLDSNPATVTITVTPVNDPPSADDKNIITPEDTAKGITLSGSDIDSGTLTFSIAGGPTNGTLTGTAPNLTYTPDPNYHGPDSFTYVANDGSLDSNPATVTITVTPVNDPPSADDKVVTTDEDVAVAVTLTGSDPDNDPLTFTVQTGPANGTLTGSGANRTYTPDPEFSGSDSFTYVANDGSVDSAPATVTITVDFVNDPPVADDQSVSTDAGVTVSITVTGSDPENDPITFALVSGPSNGQLTGTLPNVNYKPQPGFSGTDSFTFVTNDGTSDSEVGTVTITVNSTMSSPSSGARIE